MHPGYMNSAKQEMKGGQEKKALFSSEDQHSMF